MIHQPPAGARDLLPVEVVQKAWINDTLQTCFQRWGYQRIVTSTIEWIDTLMAGGAIDPATVIALQPSADGGLGLRPELTASIARAAVSRLADVTYPQRLCYRANVFRQPPPGYHGRQMEFYQAGVELLFSGGIVADCEILLLLANCMDALGLEDWQVILGEAGLTRSLLAPFPEPLRRQVRYFLAHLDRVGLQSLDYPSADLQARANSIFDLRGNPQVVLEKAIALGVDSEGKAAIADLRSSIDLVQSSHSPPLPLILDLSLVQTFDYYTGIVFKAVSQSGQNLHILAQGGRYDRLLGLYHPQRQSAPGIGFSVNLEPLHTCLLQANGLPAEVPSSDWLVIAQNPAARIAAFHYAQKLRQSSDLLRVELDLGQRSPLELREYARHCRIHHLAWIQEDGSVKIEEI